MPRKKVRIDVELTRRDNYIQHLDNRKYVKALPPELQMTYLTATYALHKMPTLSAFGADSYNDEDWQLIVNLAQQRGLQAFYINPWYTSDEGWADFQAQWQNLPDARDVLQPQTDPALVEG